MSFIGYMTAYQIKPKQNMSLVFVKEKTLNNDIKMYCLSVIRSKQSVCNYKFKNIIVIMINIVKACKLFFDL